MDDDSGEWEPYYDDDEAQRLVGKRILVGLTHRNHDDEVVRYEQFHGKVIRVSESGGIIVLVHNSDVERWLPPELSRIQEAPPGEYRLKSTGEVVVNPDFLVTWTVYPPKQDGGAQDT